MNIILLILVILAVVIALKLLKKLFKVALFVIFSIIFVTAIVSYFAISDFKSMDDEKIVFLSYSDNATIDADRYVLFYSDEPLNLSNSQIVKYYYKRDVEVMPETALFKIIKVIR